MVISFSGAGSCRLQKMRLNTPVNGSLTVLYLFFSALYRGLMHIASQQVSEWIDGFLFVANRPILDLLNTKPVLADEPTELLPDVHALERWLIASGTVSPVKDKAAVRSWRNSAEAEAFLKQLIEFRERLRDVVLRI